MRRSSQDSDVALLSQSTCSRSRPSVVPSACSKTSTFCGTVSFSKFGAAWSIARCSVLSTIWRASRYSRMRPWSVSQCGTQPMRPLLGESGMTA